MFSLYTIWTYPSETSHENRYLGLFFLPKIPSTVLNNSTLFSLQCGINFISIPTSFDLRPTMPVAQLWRRSSQHATQETHTQLLLDRQDTHEHHWRSQAAPLTVPHRHSTETLTLMCCMIADQPHLHAAPARHNCR